LVCGGHGGRWGGRPRRGGDGGGQRGGSGQREQEASGAVAASDPYLWLEDVHGAKPLEWVKAQNARSTAILQADPSYQKDYDAILRVMDAPDRIPYGDLDHQYVFNFWQDAQHPKGVWRRTSVADYAKSGARLGHPARPGSAGGGRSTRNWVWKGAECTPSLKHCLLHLSRGGR